MGETDGDAAMKRDDRPPATVAGLMTEDLLSILPQDNVGRARDVMLSLGIHAVLVMDGNDVRGIVTSTDLLDSWPDKEPIATVMTRAPVSINIQTPVREAARAMIVGRTHHLLVADEVDGESEVVGILSSLDLLEAITIDPT
jgi:CBS domain-containing protein